MIPDSATSPGGRLTGVSRAASVLALAIAVLALLGWTTDIPALRTFGGSDPMNPVTAVGLLLTAGALWCLTPREPELWLRWVGWSLGGMALLLGGLQLGRGLGWSPGLDNLLFARAMAAFGGVPMATPTAVSLCIASTGLLLVNSETRGVRPAEALGLICVIIAFHEIGGQLVDGAGTNVVPMALNTALAFVALGAGIAAARPDRGLMGSLRSSSSLRRQVNLGFGVGAAVLFIVGSIATWSSLGSQAAARERRALFERRIRIERLLGALQDAETGQRGYLITGDTAFLRPYTEVVSSFSSRLAAILADLVAHPDRRARADTLDRVVGQLLAELGQTIQLRREGRTEEAVRITRQGNGKKQMDRARELVATLVGDESALLAVWDSRLRAADKISFLTSSAGALLTVIFLLVGIRAINRNITARERAEDGLRESEQRLIRLIEALPVAIYVLDAEGRPFYANRASQKILGQAIDPGIHARDIPRVYAAYVAGTDQLYPADRLPSLRALGGESVHVEDIVIRRPERTIPLEVWAAPVYDSDGRVAFAVAVFNDIQERQDARQAIRALNDELSRRVVELEDVNRELEAFAYSISHDLRAPVRHIDGFARLLAESLVSGDTAQSSHFLTRIREGAGAVGLLIDDLLRLSRLGRQDLILQRSDLNALVRAVIYDLRDETKGRDIEWHVQKLRTVECDPRLVTQVFVNLVTNALKFSRGRPRTVIEIAETSVDGGTPAIFVRDNGVGFDMRYADKLFGVFQRLHRNEEFEGTGVGLAIVHRIVRKHGGRVWAEAELDKGATFYFTLGSSARAANGKEPA